MRRTVQAQPQEFPRHRGIGPVRMALRALDPANLARTDNEFIALNAKMSLAAQAEEEIVPAAHTPLDIIIRGGL